MKILIPVSAGELIDRVTILRIKRERLQDAAKLAHVAAELGQLEAVLEDALSPRPEAAELVGRLTEVNGGLWEVEDELRALEVAGDFDEGFIRAARSVYALNDERHLLKRGLSVLYESEIVEEKSHGSPPSGGDVARHP